MSWTAIWTWLLSPVTVPVWALIAIFIGGLVADLVLKVISWELDTNKRLAQIDHEMEQDHSQAW